LEKGQAIVLIAIMLAVVVAMAALAIDGSRAYALRRDLQAAVDAAALAASDRLQQTGSYSSAEQAATTIFGTNLRLYVAPSCAPGYGAPGASPLTLTCTYADGTVLTEVVSGLGPQGSQFRMSATRTLALNFARILTSGTNPTIASYSVGGVNNLLYTPALGALAGAGCGGTGGNAVVVNGSGTLSVLGDVVSNGAISVAAGSIRNAGDIYARCQASVTGSVSACFPSGAPTPCVFPDVAGATRSGYQLTDPAFPPPTLSGGSRGAPGSNVVLQAGSYAANPGFSSGDCWFLSGGVYNWQGGFTNSGDFVSNELKPPDEPSTANVRQVSANQFWNTNGVKCAGSILLTNVGGANAIDAGNWGVVVTSVRTDTYGGVSYRRESAPSACEAVHVHAGEVLQVQISNIPGATSYNVYASNTASGCNGPWGLVTAIPVVGTVSNSNTNPCPSFTGNGCSLGHETAVLDSTLLPDSFAPNPLAAPDTFEAYQPDPETAPLTGTLPNQNPVRGAGASGDRANENNCDTTAAVYSSCPEAVTPGAVEFYVPNGGCLSTTNGGNTYVFSGYQYNWVAMFEPGSSSPPANTCNNTLGAAGNSAYIGLVYAPSAAVAVISPSTFEAAATGGLLANTLTFTGALPSITYGSSYAPVAPAALLTG
jgi:Flp pilus assembly protein TadG